MSGGRTIDIYRDKSWDNAPDWRWKQALYERSMERKGDRDFVASHDLTVKLAKRFLETWEDPKLQGARCRELMPAMTFVHDIHEENSAGCTRHALEAALVARAEPRFIQRKVHKKLTPFITRMYELLYYDVLDKLDSPFWVEKYIFAPAMAHRPGPELTSDLVWKVVAYTGGQERLMMDCLRGHTYKGKSAEWVVEHVLSENARAALNYVHTSDKLPKELTMASRQHTIGSWEDRAARLSEIGGTSDGSGVPAELATFRNALKMTDPDKKMPAKEELGSDVYKYSDGDLEK